jgi:two-component system nitrate/nitrite response regulator NarL
MPAPLLASSDLIHAGTGLKEPSLAHHVAPPRIVLIDHTVDDVPPPASQVLRVLIVAEDPLARAGVAAILAGLPECLVVGLAAPDAELVHSFERLDPDAVVWDAGREATLPDLAGLGDAAPPIVMLGGGDVPAVPGAVTGIRGLLPRDVDARTLMSALRAVTDGLVVVDPVFASALRSSRDRSAVVLPESLTPREVEVLRLLAAGLPNKVIADRLGISEHTVRFHLNTIFGKLEVHTRTEAVTRAARLGVITL